MSRRVLVGFIFVNVLVSLAVAVLVFSLYDRFVAPEPEAAEGPTQIVVLTATRAPGELPPADYQETIDVLQLNITELAENAAVVAVVTATPDPNAEGVEVAQASPVATIPPEFLPEVPTDPPPGQPTPTQADDGCVRHAVQAGEVISVIADNYGVFPGDVLDANGLTPDDALRLQIGQILIIPVPGCDILITPTPPPAPTNTPFQLTRVAVTVTAPPTAVNAQVIIEEVQFPGDINNEVVLLRNLGDVVNLGGWQLTTANGDTFTFPEVRMQPGSPIRVFTRQGSNTPAALYWGRETAAWQAGGLLQLFDGSGGLQHQFTISE